MALQPQNRGQQLAGHLLHAAALAGGRNLGGQLYNTIRRGAQRHFARTGSSSASVSRMPKRRRTGSSSSSSSKFKKGTDRVGGYFGRYAGVVGEKKFFDGAKAATVTATAGTIFDDSLCKIPQGVTEKTRVGRLANLHSLHINGYVYLPASTDATKSADAVRIILYIDKQCNGVVAGKSDILEGATVDYNDFRNLANSHRFFILMDKRVAISAMGMGEAAGPITQSSEAARTFTYNKHFKVPLPIEFSSTTGAITEIRSNNIGMLVVSRNGVIKLEYQWRIRFTD